jgi:diguanylate cyclase (GGDEF)-like protein
MPSAAHFDGHRRVRLLEALCVAGIVPLLAMAVVRYAIDGWRAPTIWLALGMAVAIGAAPLVHRWTGSFRVAAAVPAVAVAAVAPVILALTGGTSAPAMIFIPFVPMLFAGFIGRRGAVALAGALAVGVAILAGLEHAGIRFDQRAHAPSVALRAVYVCAGVTLAAFAAFMKERERERVAQRLEDAARALYESSIRDGLTHLFNRRHFSDRLDAELSYARRRGTRLGLMLIDVDFFKRVNDTHGHAAGDAVLVEVGRRFAGELRQEDIVARYGGEEFVVALRDLTLERTRLVAERLRAAVERQPVAHDGQEIAVTVSIGCSAIDSDPSVPRDALVAAADARLYAAKRGGRNRVEC